MKKPFASKFWFVPVLIGIIAISTTFPNSIDPFKLRKNTLYIFTGSDWCSNCHHLNKKVINNKLFQDFKSQNNFEIVELDFPQRARQSDSVANINKYLADRLNFTGEFPSLVYIGKDTNSLHYFPYQKESVLDFIEKMQSIISND